MRLSNLKKIVHILSIILVINYITYSQHLGSSRNIAIAAASSNTFDINSMDWNPAGLIYINDWKLDFTSFLSPTINNSGLSFQNFGVAKKFADKHSLAIRYSPGSILNFVLPTTFTFFDADDNPIHANFDKEFSYHQKYSLGYASRILSDFTIGIGTRFYEVKISDTKYSLDTNNVIITQINDYTSAQWGVDIGGIYEPYQNLNIGIVFKNLIVIKESELNEGVKNYQLTLPKIVRLGLSYWFDDLLLSFDLDTKKNLNFGIELPAFGFLKLRSGMYSSEFNKIDAGAIGLGFTYQNFQFDLSYLKFIDQKNRKGTAHLHSFFETNLLDIDYNSFTPDRISFSIGIRMGKTKEQFVKIEYVEIFGELFPSAYHTYAFRPIGKVRVKNISTKPVEARVSFYIKNFMEEPTQTKPLKLLPGEIAELPIFAIFNNAIHHVKSFAIYDGKVYVYAEPTNDFDDQAQTPVIIRGRNDWNGDVTQLRYFITPDDPEVLKFSRNTIQKRNSGDGDALLTKFENAKILFDELSKIITYINDPNQSTDFVQYPAETLDLHGGDCDDITVCYAALLESIGIRVALIDVIPPENPRNAHIYMMFDTGLPVENASLISDNSKKYIIRKNLDGKESVWIPVETTMISKGFTEAWNYGATEYFKNAVLKSGLLEGWIRIVDLNTIY